MTITTSDLKFFGSQYPLDLPYGGGRMSASIIQTATQNTVFPDIDVAARATGRTQVRKIYAAITSIDTDLLGGAYFGMASQPSDAAVDVVAVQTSQNSTVSQLALLDYGRLKTFAQSGGQFSTASLYDTIYPIYQSRNGLTASANQAVVVYNTIGLFGFLSPTPAIGDIHELPSEVGYFRVVTALGAGDSAGQLITYSGASFTLAASFYGTGYLVSQPINPFVSGTALALSASTGAGISVSLVKNKGTPTIASNSGSLTKNSVQIFRVGQAVQLKNGATEETAVVAAANHATGLTFTRALVNSYPAGSTVSSLLPLGDMQQAVGASFSQQTWTRVFADAPLGNLISAQYNRGTGSIVSTNAGAETERWACVFTSATEYRLYGENVGQIASGTIGTAFAPLNPITNSPYFTIPTAGWGSGWAIGNVLRFNTTGSRAPIWLVRTVAPSAVGATVDGSSIALRGTVNA